MKPTRYDIPIGEGLFPDLFAQTPLRSQKNLHEIGDIFGTRPICDILQQIGDCIHSVFQSWTLGAYSLLTWRGFSFSLIVAMS